MPAVYVKPRKARFCNTASTHGGCDCSSAHDKSTANIDQKWPSQTGTSVDHLPRRWPSGVGDPGTNLTPGTDPAVGLSTHAWARRQAAEKPQGPRGLSEAGIATDSAEEPTVSDTPLGFIGAFEDAEYMHLISSTGASPGPFRRERRAAPRRTVSEMHPPPTLTRQIHSLPLIHT